MYSHFNIKLKQLIKSTKTKRVVFMPKHNLQIMGRKQIFKMPKNYITKQIHGYLERDFSPRKRLLFTSTKRFTLQVYKSATKTDGSKLSSFLVNLSKDQIENITIPFILNDARNKMLIQKRIFKNRSKISTEIK